MHTKTRTGHLLHEDHQRILGMVGRLEALLDRCGDAAPDLARDREARRFLADFDAALADDVGRHFPFEEEALFPLLGAAGAFELAATLTAEHDEMRRLARRLRQICAAALGAGFEAEDWILFAAFASDLARRQVAHLQTEEIALLQTVDDLLSPEQDHALSLVLATRPEAGAA
jgi:hemerythrin-like domain-containing protein